MKTRRFQTELIAGHKGVVAVIVPFDPAREWGIDATLVDHAVYRERPGYLVRGTLDGCRFDGWIGLRWSRYFIIVDDELQARAGVKPGDQVTLSIAPIEKRSSPVKSKR